MTIKEITVNGTTYDIGANYENITGTPTNLSDFTNDEGYAKSEDLSTVATSGAYSDLSGTPDLSGYITASVDNLANYYLKDETYTRQEVLNLIGQLQKLTKEVVNILPVTGEDNVMYLVPKSTAGTSNVYDEYLYINNAWEKVGDTEIDLTNYVQKTDYATQNVGGVIKVNSSYGAYVDENGIIRGYVMSTANDYANAYNSALISKGTLETALTSKGYEASANKVTSISSSSTDTQYPSAKCVYDAIEDAIDTSITQVLGGSY